MSWGRRALIVSVLGFLSLAGCGNQMTSDETLSPSSLAVRPGEGDLGDRIVFDDILVDQTENRSLGGANDSELRERAADGLLTYNSKKWRNGIVPVLFDQTVSQANRTMFFAACEEWQEAANVRCTSRTNERNYLYVTDDDNQGCYTDVGAGISNARRIFNFGIGWCWYREGMIHELGHVLGLMHEHQRPDRDKFISIRLSGVESNHTFAYKKFRTSRVYSPYDFHSIMHYHQLAYSKDGGAVIIAKEAYTVYQDTMGRATELSHGDKSVIARLYGPPVATVP